MRSKWPRRSSVKGYRAIGEADLVPDGPRSLGDPAGLDLVQHAACNIDIEPRRSGRIRRDRRRAILCVD